MKKLISLVTLVAVIASFSLCAFADTDVSDKITGNETTLEATDGVYTVEAESTGDYATILAVKGKTIKVGAIQYINQDTTTEGKATFNFALNDDILGNETSSKIDDDVYVLTGGDSNGIKVAGKIDTTPDAPQPTAFTVSGTVSNAPSQSFITDELSALAEEIYGAEAVAGYLAPYEITAHLIAEEEFENFIYWSIGEDAEFTALQTAKVSFEDGSYSFSDVENGTYAVALTADGALTWVDYVIVDGENVTVDAVELLYGDVITAKDAMIDGTDVYYAVENMCDIETETFNGAYEVSFDCMIDGTDIFYIVANMGDIYAYDTPFINENY